MAEQLINEQPELGPGLRMIRRRRWFLWALIIAYVPAIWLSLELTGSDMVTGGVFAVWLIFVCIAIVLGALAKCPRCGNYFHVHGLTLLYLRKCLHCQLHVSADKHK